MAFSIPGPALLLRDLDLKGLRVSWRNAFGKPAPEHLTRYLLFRIIAYRLQADRFGDLDAETLKVLKQAARQEGPILAVSKTLARLDQRRFAPPPGDCSGAGMGPKVPSGHGHAGRFCMER